MIQEWATQKGKGPYGLYWKTAGALVLVTLIGFNAIYTVRPAYAATKTWLATEAPAAWQAARDKIQATLNGTIYCPRE